MVSLATGRPSLHLLLLLPGHVVDLAHPQRVSSSSPRRLSQRRDGFGNQERTVQDERGQRDQGFKDLVYESGKALRGCEGDNVRQTWSLESEAGVFVARGGELY